MDVATNLRVWNFSAGPAALPLSVLQQVQEHLLSLPDAGCSILEISHRSDLFVEILNEAKNRLRQLLDISEQYEILFLQGGGRLQFAMVPMNLMRPGQRAAYLVTGSWGAKARENAQRVGQVETVWDGKATNFDRIPMADQFNVSPGAQYLHFTSNETIQGVQFDSEPQCGEIPLVCDASSELLSRKIDVSRYGLIYACAQKNLGPAGVTVVIIRRDLLERSSDSLPEYLSYKLHAAENSLLNTAPTFAIYVVNLVCQWLIDEIGGLAQMESINRRKAAMLYEVIDESQGFYRGHAQMNSRSINNVPFKIDSDSLQKQFLQEATSHQLCHLEGHRSVGGMRASIYNAMPIEGVAALAEFMRDFAGAHA